MRILEMDEDEFEVLCTLLDFHAGSDEPDEYYPDAPFRSLCGKAGVEVPPSASTTAPGRTAPMTIEAFRATRRFHQDCPADLDQSFLYVDDPDQPPEGRGPTYGHPKPVLEYEGCLIGVVTRFWPMPAMLRGLYHLQVFNQEWVTDDLAFLEEQLYDFYLSFTNPLNGEQDPDGDSVGRMLGRNE